MTYVLILFIVLLSLFVLMVTAGICYDYGYKEGQVDYANGRVEYHLYKKADSTTVWLSRKDPNAKCWRLVR